MPRMLGVVMFRFRVPTQACLGNVFLDIERFDVIMLQLSKLGCKFCLCKEVSLL